MAAAWLYPGYAGLGWRAFSFPSYFGRNWDAVTDCFRDVNWPPRLALFWEDADAFAAADPRTFGEACAFLTESFEALGATESKQALLILSGSHDRFDQPN